MELKVVSPCGKDVSSIPLIVALGLFTGSVVAKTFGVLRADGAVIFLWGWTFLSKRCQTGRSPSLVGYLHSRITEFQGLSEPSLLLGLTTTKKKFQRGDDATIGCHRECYGSPVFVCVVVLLLIAILIIVNTVGDWCSVSNLFESLQFDEFLTNLVTRVRTPDEHVFCLLQICASVLRSLSWFKTNSNMYKYPLLYYI
jgi:hypothetical protein